MPLGTLPASAKKQWESVYQSAKKDGDSTEQAAKKAWGAVKNSGWKKIDGKWVKKSDAIVEMSMYITKASIDGKVMKWSAVNSDTDPDSYAERMSYDLYEDFIGHINRKEDVPEVFRSAVYSDYWKGGMPYVSVSHYSDLNGDAVPGEPSEIYIDGDKSKAKLKAKGIFYNSPLGHAVYRSLLEDKNKSTDDKIRISIGFLDLAHRHGDGQLWMRKSLTDVCPQCLDKVGKKVYVKGYLVHLALTRVPVNKRTEMVLEEKSMATKKKVTRKEDAASIVGASLAEEIDAKSKVTAMRSDVLVEMSETPEETQELIEEVENQEPVEEKAEVETPEVPEVPETPAEPVEEKSEPEVVEEKMEGMMLPYGGATSMKDAQKAKEAVEEMAHVMDLWGMFSNVAWNIIDRDDVTDKKSAFVKALDEFKGMLAAKAMVEFSIVEKSENDHPLKPALDALLSAVDNSLGFEGDVNAKLQAVQPALTDLGNAITDHVTERSVASEPPAPDKDNDNLLEKITELIQPLSQAVTVLTEEVGVLKAKSNAQSVEPQRPRIPNPRTLSPSIVKKAQPEVKPGSIKDIVRKSVGITD